MNNSQLCERYCTLIQKDNDLEMVQFLCELDLIKIAIKIIIKLKECR